MSRGRKVWCALCKLSRETDVTGPLSTKLSITAHQNCLLYSSGIYCQSSPEFDELFGFSVDDVEEEVTRGNKLVCHKCKKRGATAGCEEKRCKKSYHYPCAIEDHAEPIDDPDKGKFGLYCPKHRPQKKDNDSVNGLASSSTKPTTSENSSEAGSSKPSEKHHIRCFLSGPTCLASNNMHVLFSRGMLSVRRQKDISVWKVCLIPLLCFIVTKKRNDDGTAARSYSSDSHSSSSRTQPKRRLNFCDQQKDVPANRRMKISDSSSNSDENKPKTDMEMIGPLESDLDESANSGPEQQFIGNDSEIPTESSSGNQPESRDKKDEDETIIHSDAESESLLHPVETCKEPQSLPKASAEVSSPTTSTACPIVYLVKTEDMRKKKDKGCSPEQRPVRIPGQHTAGPSAPQQSCTGTSPSPDDSQPHNVTGSPPCTNAGISPDPPEVTCVSLLSSSPSSSPVTRPSEPSIDSVSFWKSCTAAGCTQAIFADFINEMNNISSRIQSDQASQEDYDLALTVMAASGKLSELVAKQQKELQRKQSELTKATAAMEEVVSVLRK